MQNKLTSSKPRKQAQQATHSKQASKQSSKHIKQDSQQASKPASQQARKPSSKQACKPTSQQAGNPASNQPQLKEPPVGGKHLCINTCICICIDYVHIYIYIYIHTQDAHMQSCLYILHLCIPVRVIHENVSLPNDLSAVPISATAPIGKTKVVRLYSVRSCLLKTYCATTLGAHFIIQIGDGPRLPPMWVSTCISDAAA